MDTRSGCRLMALALVIPAVLLCLSAASASGIYRTVDEDGNVLFTDQPPEDGAEAERLGDINVGQSTEVRAREQDASPSAEAEGNNGPRYDGVEIVFPPAGEATRRVTGDVPVRVSLQPDAVELASGHRVRILVDGESAGEAPATEVTVGPLIPGPHHLRAEVVTAAGETIVRSPEIRFYLIRQTANN